MPHSKCQMCFLLNADLFGTIIKLKKSPKSNYPQSETICLSSTLANPQAPNLQACKADTKETGRGNPSSSRLLAMERRLKASLHHKVSFICWGASVVFIEIGLEAVCVLRVLLHTS